MFIPALSANLTKFNKLTVPNPASLLGPKLGNVIRSTPISLP